MTGKEYKTISYDRLSCGSANVTYGIHCVHCGLVYVGEPGRSLRSRMNGLDQPLKREDKAYSTDTSINQIILWMTRECKSLRNFTTVLKIQPCLTSFCRTRELFWIKELGTAKPCGFNDQIKGVGTLSSISCKKTNIYSLFNKQPRRKRSHGKRHYNKRAPQSDVTMSTLVDLVDMTEKPEGVQKINTKLFSI